MLRRHDILPGDPGRTPVSEWTTTAWPAGWTVDHVVQTGSTNADLLALRACGRAADRTVLVADHQTAGRGRRDRRWDAPPAENLLVSLLFEAPPADPARTVQRLGLAIVDGVEELIEGPVPLGLKWPNDVVVGDRKLAGILAERSGDAIVVGAGVNVGWAPAGAARLADLVAPGRQAPSRAELLAAVLAAHDRLSAGELAARYRDRLTTLGRRVRAELPGGGDLTGVAADVEPSGALVIVDDAGERHVLFAGDVVHLRDA